jgi:hypothetical protein
MNAHRANRFQLRATTFSLSAALVTGDCHGIVSHRACGIALGFRRHINGCRLAVGNCGFGVARPRRGSGHRWHFPQLAMAVVVYGASALVVGAGLIGTEKRPN